MLHQGGNSAVNMQRLRLVFEATLVLEADDEMDFP